MKRSTKIAIPLVAVGALMTSLLGAPLPALATAPTGPVNGFNAAPSARPWTGYLGANPDGWFAPGASAKVNREVAQMKELGSDVVRVEFPWFLIEPTDEAYDWTRVDQIVGAVKSAGMDLHIQAFYTPQWAALRGNSTAGASCAITEDLYTSSAPIAGAYADFLTDLITHVQATNPGGLDYIEIGNEFDIPRYWSRPNTINEYVNNMLIPGYNAIKAADPAIKVLSGGVANSGTLSWINSVLDAGGTGYFDIFSFHTYGDGSSVNSNASMFRTFLNSRGLSAVPIWVTEFGGENSSVNDSPRQSTISTVFANATLQGVEQYEITDDDVWGSATGFCQREYYGILDHDALVPRASFATWQALAGGGPFVSVDDAVVGSNAQQIQYAGTWFAATGATDGRNNSTTHYSNTTNSTATMTFSGKRVQVFSNVSQGGGRLSISVDGGTAVVIDSYSAIYRTNQMIFDTGALTTGTHSIVLKALGTHNAASTNSWVDFDRFIVTSGTPVTVDDSTVGSSPNQFSYSGSWGAATGSGDGRYAGSTHYSHQAGNTATLVVVGNTIEVRANKSAGGGKATIVIDGGTAVTVDTYSSGYRTDASIYLSPALAYGTHTVVITVTGTASPGSTDSWVDLDRVVTT